MQKKTCPKEAVRPLKLREPAVAYESKHSVLHTLSDEYLAALSADEIDDLSHCITGKELEKRVIARLEKKLPNQSCK
ncbi:MAG: hypothetical protein Q4G48_00990 [Bacteroidia bacterium]|nr:hypothetical protein [Bacteroidia bacterium]